MFNLLNKYLVGIYVFQSVKTCFCRLLTIGCAFPVRNFIWYVILFKCYTMLVLCMFLHETCSLQFLLDITITQLDFYSRIDDIEDSSILRRGMPVAHSIYGVPSTINSANYVYFMALSRVSELNHPEAYSIFTGTNKLTLNKLKYNMTPTFIYVCRTDVRTS